MTVAEPVEDLTGLQFDQVPGATGHVVIVEGTDHNGAEAIAVWHVSASGIPVGAWITPISALSNDPVAAEGLLRLTAQRALFGWDTASARRLLDTLAGWAQRSATPEPVEALLPDVLAEIAAHRRAYEGAVAEHHRAANTKLSPLVWRREVPLVESWPEFVAAARLHRPTATCPAAAQALHLVRAAAWAVELWHQTETARGRRSYLTERFGAAISLPPGWLHRLHQAQTTTTPRV